MIQQTMDHFESSIIMISEHSAHFTNILGSDLVIRSENAITDFKHAQRHTVALVALEGFQESREQRGSGGLEISGFGIGNSDVVIGFGANLLGDFLDTA